jgi:hypothetical protein
MPTGERAMTPKRLRALGVGMVVALGAACNARQTRLQALRLWQGEASCGDCRAAAIELMDYKGGPLRLTRGSVYTVEAELDPGEEPNRCIYYMIQYATWEVRPGRPSHEFLCTETGSSVTSELSTIAATADPGSMLIRVEEFDWLRREMVTEHYAREFAVAWLPE